MWRGCSGKRPAQDRDKIDQAIASRRAHRRQADRTVPILGLERDGLGDAEGIDPVPRRRLPARRPRPIAAYQAATGNAPAAAPPAQPVAASPAGGGPAADERRRRLIASLGIETRQRRRRGFLLSGRNIARDDLTAMASALPTKYRPPGRRAAEHSRRVHAANRQPLSLVSPIEVGTRPARHRSGRVVERTCPLRPRQCGGGKDDVQSRHRQAGTHVPPCRLLRARPSSVARDHSSPIRLK